MFSEYLSVANVYELKEFYVKGHLNMWKKIIKHLHLLLIYEELPWILGYWVEPMILTRVYTNE